MESGTGHRSVLREEVVDILSPAGGKENPVILDCTLGLGGHTAAVLANFGKDATAIGMDADEGNVILAKKNLADFGGRVRFFHANFSQADEVLQAAEIQGVDALIADLGFASNQMDNPDRGMSFQADGPLDMRLDQSARRTAADIVNHTPEGELADLIYGYGEERLSRRIAKAIVLARKIEPITRTGQLAEIVKRATPAPKHHHTRRKIHPATRTFQALRIAVNDELGSLEKLLANLMRLLNPGGRAAIISFHSLEDRRVKQAFQAMAGTGEATILTKKPIIATDDEVAENPRSRSAKLRGIEKIDTGCVS